MAEQQTKTAEKPNTTTQAPPQEARNKGDVAIFKAPRLPWDARIQQRFPEIDKGAWRTLTDAIFPLAKTTDSIMLALNYCKARNLDPFKRVIHIVPIYDKESNKYVETIWPGIAELRTTAARTGSYAGKDACMFGDVLEQTFTGTTGGRGGKAERTIKRTVKFPEWAQITVHRIVQGQRVPFIGPKVFWLETYATIGRTDVPNDMWNDRPSGQLEKCAEAAALRVAFPEELGSEHIHDEVGRAGIEPQPEPGDNARVVNPEPERPTRESVRNDVKAEAITTTTQAASEERSQPAGEGREVEAEAERVDEETGEITESDPAQVAADEGVEHGFAVMNGEDSVYWAGGDEKLFVEKLLHLFKIAATIEIVTKLLQLNGADIQKVSAEHKQAINEAVNAKLAKPAPQKEKGK